MILTESQLAKLAAGANIIREVNTTTRYFSTGKRTSVFLSHKHDDIASLKRVAYILEQLDAAIYVDWLDNSIPKRTSGETARIIKEKIIKYDKFILVASEGAIASEWCNWELGFGDAHKYENGKIALFPIAQDNSEWSGSEYLQIYPTIRYYDGKTENYRNGGIIPQGYYYQFKKEGFYYLTPLLEWLNS